MIANGKLREVALSLLQDKVKGLNKRAVRLGLEPMTLTVVRVEEVDTKNPSGLPQTVKVNHIELNGCAPCINGWTVVARIEFTEAGNLVHCAPHAGSVDHAWKTCGNVCQHCNTKRRRNDVIVIRHTDGREIIVGRNCLADYIRSADAEGLIEYASWLGSVETLVSDCEDCDEYHGPRAKPTERLETVVAAASICIRKLGWVSGSVAYDKNIGSTKNDVFSLLFPPYNSAARADWKAWIKDCDLTICKHDTDLAAKAIEWAKSLDAGESEYLHNLKTLAQLESVDASKFGYIVSIIPAYNRAVERETEYADEKAAKGTKVFIGEPKKRMKAVEATCVGVRSFEGAYGVTTMVRFEARVDSDSYAVLTWFATGDKTEEWGVGELYTFDATCKKHEDNSKYGKQTMINRVKLS